MMIWSEFLERMQEMDIEPGATVVRVEYSFTDPEDAVIVEVIEEITKDEAVWEDQFETYEEM